MILVSKLSIVRPGLSYDFDSFHENDKWAEIKSQIV